MADGRDRSATMREAVSYLPAADRERLMVAYRERRTVAWLSPRTWSEG